MKKTDDTVSKPNTDRFFDPPLSTPKRQPPNALIMKAGRLAGFDGRDGWPDVLSINEFSALQFPDDEADRSDLLRALWGFKWSNWLADHGVTVIRDNAPGPGVCRKSGGQLLHRYGVQPSELLQGWLGSPPVNAETTGDSHSGRLEYVLCECERRSMEQGKTFDRWNMPGKKNDLLELLKKLEPRFKNMTSVQSLDRYLKGVCTWSLRAKSNPDATPLYRELFPEARGNHGAVLENRRKA
ncbi:MAG: hypothetical protein RBS05_14020 [Zoogloea oleivorans]|jgi:hypothetical protein|uniref:hypothetical protein n=1 Tax=Zoogloea oleivorans TaxID=1552750 RepID=UPI002A371383|nr:hypothetical protein [Zoogloea oleivorans]MDY0037023.1 hypothetical protein [Zoogloea oleivorans]